MSSLAEPESNANKTGVTSAASEVSSDEINKNKPELTPEQIEFNKKKKFKSLLIDRLKNAVIIEVTTAEQARMGQRAGAKAIIVKSSSGRGAMPNIPPGYGHGASGNSKMLDPVIITQFIDAVALPIIGCIRQGHTVEAYVMEKTGVDMIEESKSFGVADETALVDKTTFTIPFMSPAFDLQTAIARINEGTQIIRFTGKDGSDVSSLATNIYKLRHKIRELKKGPEEEIEKFAEENKVPIKLVNEVLKLGRLPVLMFASGQFSTPEDVAFFMNFGCDGIILGDDTFGGMDSERRISNLIQAVKCYKDKNAIAELMRDFDF